MLGNIITNNKIIELDLTQKQRKILIKTKSISSKHLDSKQYMFIVPWMQCDDEKSSLAVKKNIIQAN